MVQGDVLGDISVLGEPTGGIQVNRGLLLGFDARDPVGEPGELSHKILVLLVLAALQSLQPWLDVFGHQQRIADHLQHLGIEQVRGDLGIAAACNASSRCCFSLTRQLHL
jgi:hypothetical protein